MTFPYRKLSIAVISGLHPRAQEVLTRRFGLDGAEPATLEAIGQEHGITRERVRQIVEDGIRQARANTRQGKEREALDQVCAALLDILREAGHVKRQDLLIEELHATQETNHVVFLLHLPEVLYKQKETEHVYPFWASRKEVYEASIAALEKILDQLEEHKEALAFEDLAREYQVISSERLHLKTLASLLEVSKHIAKSYEGKWGLRAWPEVYPRGMRDKAYVVLKNAGKPLHFAEVARLIAALQQALANQKGKQVLPQTVHNELIKDPRFVLVGRGTYGLAEWGLKPGTVKEVMLEILKENGSRMSKEELIQKTLSQRQVKESTILLNLQDKTCFLRDDGGYYCLPGR